MEDDGRIPRVSVALTSQGKRIFLVQMEGLNRPPQCRSELYATFGGLATEEAKLCLPKQDLSLWDQESRPQPTRGEVASNCNICHIGQQSFGNFAHAMANCHAERRFKPCEEHGLRQLWL